jgi:ribosomal protein S14
MRIEEAERGVEAAEPGGRVKMRYRRCSICGVPRIVARFNSWKGNGTIVSMGDPHIRQVFFEADLLPGLRTRISEGLQFPVNRIFYEAERNAVRAVIDALLRSHRVRYGLRIPPFRRGAVYFFHQLAMMTGTARTSTVDYRPGKYGVALVRNPWDVDLMAAVVVGAFEALEGRPLRSFWKKRNGEYILRVEVTEGKPEISQRLEVDFPPVQEGNYRHHRCPKCGVPREIKHLEWREEEGLLLDRRRGIRMLNWEGLTLRMVARELIRELGEEVVPIIVDAERDYTLRMLEDLGIVRAPLDQRRELLQQMLSLLPLYGQGLAREVEYESGGAMRIWMINPYEEHFLAGRLAAFYQVVEGVRARVEWIQTGPAEVSYLLAPSEG